MPSLPCNLVYIPFTAISLPSNEEMLKCLLKTIISVREDQSSFQLISSNDLSKLTLCTQEITVV